MYVIDIYCNVTDSDLFSNSVFRCCRGELLKQKLDQKNLKKSWWPAEVVLQRNAAYV